MLTRLESVFSQCLRARIQVSIRPRQACAQKVARGSACGARGVSVDFRVSEVVAHIVLRIDGRGCARAGLGRHEDRKSTKGHEEKRGTEETEREPPKHHGFCRRRPRQHSHWLHADPWRPARGERVGGTRRHEGHEGTRRKDWGTEGKEGKEEPRIGRMGRMNGRGWARGQRPDVRGQTSEVRRQRSDVRGQTSEVGAGRCVATHPTD
jgi:hypothetical protein